MCVLITLERECVTMETDMHVVPIEDNMIGDGKRDARTLTLAASLNPSIHAKALISFQKFFVHLFVCDKYCPVMN